MIGLFKRQGAWAWALLAGLAIAAGIDVGAAHAAQPVPWQMGLQPAATDVHQEIRWFEGFTLAIITVITLFVLGLLVYVMVKFNAKANPVPSKTSHNTLIEVVWTVLPVMILVIIAIPSFRLLYRQLEIPPADLTVKATGYQWYWGYEYPDLKDGKGNPVSFDSVMIADDARVDPIKQPRMLAVDNMLVVPVGKIVRVQVTAADVIHALAVPSFGIKVDGYPGRLNETWFKANYTGIFYGQCSELCGKDHAAMPIAVQVVTQDQYAAWSAAAAKSLKDAGKVLAEMIEADEKKTAVAAR
ncbi:cytochrome c oxidase subunit II [Prosthecomicrobium sp. N25]|uniref:cytochrome c oxidase subunit II n=1 Tax=Prosthecomicrobium sp. N25 TaxID=3129254 RepID=UPI0030775A8B